MKTLLMASLLAIFSPVALSQSAAAKHITLVVPYAAGGSADRLARDLVDALRKPLWGTTITIENLPGTGGIAGTVKVAHAAPDGQTLLLTNIGMAAAPALYRKLPYKPLEDFEYLGLVNEVPMTLIGKPQFPANTYRDLENHIRANAGKLALAHAGLGSPSHLCGLMWQNAFKPAHALNWVTFPNSAPAMTALIAGKVDVMCDQTTNTTSQIEAGRVKAFAVTTSKPMSSHKLLKDYPSLAEMGLRNFHFTVWHGLYAPKGTPAALIKKINDALKLALKDPEFTKRQEAAGALVITDKRVEPEVHKAFVAEQMSKLKQLIDASGQYAD